MDKYASGGCLCGDVRYICFSKPIMSGLCHCRDCQKNTGSAHAPILIFAKDKVEVSGASAKTFEHEGDSGKTVKRSFCMNCGSSFMAEYEVTPNFRVIMGGTLDDPSLIKPEWNIYTSSKQPWIELSPHMKSFEGGFKKE